ncbi:MAG: hypothetical protein A2175_00365 [Candidatus Nealsonbacteria bacterium RBG_13_42_11]|uniref:Uncharacterized protein n=1 Tax=Candidatus Nealsonbacteria bacterium RBG_13_42_11 TaxID=1801663 RepID=A0A1G2E0P6_9BACT|nr:MAG: hypothetical protein A2175_00365 [Candidatus Nealsonbacteria bacterium RBG_13_42_11]
MDATLSRPDAVWVITNKEDETKFIVDQGKLFVFSAEELANKYMERIGLKGGVPSYFTWDELLDKFSHSFSHVVIDHTGQAGSFSTVPAKKD